VLLRKFAEQMRAKQQEKQKKLSDEERRRVSPELSYCTTPHLTLLDFQIFFWNNHDA
jgi:hypothetical protein